MTPPDKSVFRNSQNTRYLKGLFLETSSDPLTVVYTLKDHEWRGYPSFYQCYLAALDPEEYVFATTYLADYEHWERLCEAQWFQPYLKKFRNHLDKYLKSNALQRIIRESEDKDSKQRFVANRFLVEKGWATANRRGRPSKAEIASAAYETATAEQRLSEDVSRLLAPKAVKL